MSNSIFDKLNAIYRGIYQHQDFIPLHEPYFNGNEKKYLENCIDSTFVSSVGQYVDSFQEAMKKYCKVDYAVATVNGTSALHLALLSCGIGANDEVICPDLTFVATAASIVYTGADPVFLDIEESTLGLSAKAMKDFLQNETYEQNGYRINKSTNKPIKACIVMHNMGFASDIKALQSICENHNIILIEDAAESLGTQYANQMCGSFGKVGIYSFNGNKVITTGGGGMLVTNDQEIYKKALHLSTTAKLAHRYLYEHDEIGYNYRMPNINAALGLAQLEQIDHILEKKKAQFEKIYKQFEDESLQLIKPNEHSNHWFIVAKLNGIDLEYFIEQLAQKKIMARPIWSQVSKMKPYQKYFSTNNIISEKVVNEYVCLPNGVAKS